jgi:hypothetical protein
MKMRKILPLAILAVGAAVLLSGCDALLDAIFSKNVINLDVWVQGSTHADFTVGASYENVMLMDSSFNVVSSPSQYYNAFDGSYAHYYYTFTNLKDGTYYLTTYYYGAFSGFHASTSVIYSGGFVTGSTSLSMPNTGYGDTSGHTANVVMIAP